MAKQYNIYSPATRADYDREMMLKRMGAMGSAYSDGSYTAPTYEEWLAANQGRGQLVKTTDKQRTIDQFLSQNPDYKVTAKREKQSGIGGAVSGAFDHIGGGLSDFIKNPGVLESALVAAGGLGASALWGPGSAGAGSAAAGGTGISGVAGGTGLTPGLGATGLNPAAAGASGLSGSYASGALAPNYFAAEGALAAGAAGAGGAFGGGSAAAGGGVGAVPAAPPVAAPVGVAPGVAGGAAAASTLPSILSNPMVLGMGAGALLGGLGGSEQAGTIESEEGIPDWLKPYMKPTLDKYASDIQNYQVDPYGVMPSAMKEFQNTISGMYLDPSTNKYLEDYFRLGAERIKGSLSPSFGHMQAFGGHSGYNEALARGLGDFSVGLYGGNYAKERDRQTTMTAAAPNFLTQSSTAAFAPYQQYLSTVGSLGRKREEPFFENPYGNILGGALLGGSLGSMFK